MISDEELAKVRTEACGLAYDGYEDWAATIECLVDEVRRLRLIETAYNKYCSGILVDDEERLIVLGKAVEALKPAHFIGREYAEELHLVEYDWDYCKIENGKYINLGFGKTALEALQAAEVKSCQE